MTNVIDEQSAQWVARSDAGLTLAEKEELEAWLAADARHRGAFARSLGYWARLDRFAALSRADQSKDLAPSRTLTRRQGIAAAAAAVAAVGIGLSWELFIRRSSTEIAPGLRYSTGIGELKRVTLEDGSLMLLNTASVALVRFDRRQRTVQLLGGEAWFQVARDRARPFIVGARTVAVRALGTEFSVKLGSSHIDLTVTEGAVQLGNSQPDAGRAVEARGATVSAVQQATITGSEEPQIRSIDPEKAMRVLAWRQGMVCFDGQSLQAAVAEINRYNRRQIIIDDLELAAKPLVGVFAVDDLDGFAAAAGAVLKAKVVADGDAIRLDSYPAP